jgi:hypothetical protein
MEPRRQADGQLRRARAGEALAIGRLSAAAVNRQIERGNYRREKAQWPWPAPVRLALLTLSSTGTALFLETWVLDAGDSRAVVSVRRVGPRSWTGVLRLLCAAIALDVVVVTFLVLMLASFGPVAALACVGALLVLGGPLLVNGLREMWRARPLRRAQRAVERTAPGPVYEASALASSGGWAGVRLMRQLIPLVEERRATVVLKAEGADRRRLYGGAGFEEAARACMFWGDCVLMVRHPSVGGPSSP